MAGICLILNLATFFKPFFKMLFLLFLFNGVMKRIKLLKSNDYRIENQTEDKKARSVWIEEVACYFTRLAQYSKLKGLHSRN